MRKDAPERGTVGVRTLRTPNRGGPEGRRHWKVQWKRYSAHMAIPDGCVIESMGWSA